ncbi:NAD(P)H-binding protein [Dactylosporangium aurantiacum]|uniref:NAD(P)H-binding protein n=1 Tax=Dactylosporangium aurantiacum TaxID=35754 RepID=A0A9Q9IIX9_9ACTN|nr:NAD(P)H-binding protein [Dactylosporangium aurantiacum]MDG6102143.1 NAD(P)H-binding protein [Dactylosporangium aurantiacum]UWZ53535.1 NAD(P)H-binding protein [Dactylosporangium aurantiacum]
MAAPVLVTGAAGGVGSVGRTVVELLRRQDVPVRALVHHDDDRADALRATGAEVVAGDLTEAGDVVRALDGCGRMYFGMSVSSRYLQATVTVAAAARSQADLAVVVNMSQMTVSQMTLTSTTESKQHRLHWLSEQVLNWSGLPVVHVRPTIFLDNPIFTTFAAGSIAADGTIRLPFGSGRTAPVAARDVAGVVAAVLTDPAPHLGKVYELTGPRSQDMTATAAEFSAALGRPITYVDVPLRQWLDEDLAPLGLPEHLRDHLATMARLHREGRYDRLTHDVETVTGHPPTSVRDFVAAAMTPR